jgi:hypothetical protein
MQLTWANLEICPEHCQPKTRMALADQRQGSVSFVPRYPGTVVLAQVLLLLLPTLTGLPTELTRILPRPSLETGCILTGLFYTQARGLGSRNAVGRLSQLTCWSAHPST